jgi:hypothetical protein
LFIPLEDSKGEFHPDLSTITFNSKMI